MIRPLGPRLGLAPARRWISQERPPRPDDSGVPHLWPLLRRRSRARPHGQPAAAEESAGSPDGSSGAASGAPHGSSAAASVPPDGSSTTAPASDDDPGAHPDPPPAGARSDGLQGSAVDSASSTPRVKDDGRFMIIMHGLSPNLTGPDFFRLAPKEVNGERVIRKFQQQRHPATLEPLGRYHISFVNPTASRLYADHLDRLHRLTRYKLQSPSDLWESTVPAHLTSPDYGGGGDGSGDVSGIGSTDVSGSSNTDGSTGVADSSSGSSSTSGSSQDSGDGSSSSIDGPSSSSGTDGSSSSSSTDSSSSSTDGSSSSTDGSSSSSSIDGSGSGSGSGSSTHGSGSNPASTSRKKPPLSPAAQLRRYTLAPGSQPALDLDRRRIMTSPWAQRFRDIVARAGHGDQRPALLLDVYPPTLSAGQLFRFIRDDGFARGSRWHVAPPHHLLPLGHAPYPQQPAEPTADAEVEAGPGDPDALAGEMFAFKDHETTDKMRGRFVVVCANEVEARRFLRRWNQRTLTTGQGEWAERHVVQASRIHW